jgi:hypothetical protein
MAAYGPPPPRPPHLSRRAASRRYDDTVSGRVGPTQEIFVPFLGPSTLTSTVLEFLFFLIMDIKSGLYARMHTQPSNTSLVQNPR